MQTVRVVDSGPVGPAAVEVIINETAVRSASITRPVEICAPELQ